MVNASISSPGPLIHCGFGRYHSADARQERKELLGPMPRTWASVDCLSCHVSNEFITGYMYGYVYTHTHSHTHTHTHTLTHTYIYIYIQRYTQKSIYLPIYLSILSYDWDQCITFSTMYHSLLQAQTCRCVEKSSWSHTFIASET